MSKGVFYVWDFISFHILIWYLTNLIVTLLFCVKHQQFVIFYDQLSGSQHLIQLIPMDGVRPMVSTGPTENPTSYHNGTSGLSMLLMVVLCLLVRYSVSQKYFVTYHCPNSRDQWEQESQNLPTPVLLKHLIQGVKIFIIQYVWCHLYFSKFSVICNGMAVSGSR